MMRSTQMWFTTYLASLLLTGSTALAAAEDFFKPVPDQAAALAPDRVYPQGRIFPFSFFSAPIDLALEAGVSLTGPWYGQPDSILNRVHEAKEAGIPTIFTVRALDDDGEPIALADLSEADLDKAEQSIRQQVADMVASDLNEAVAWWYIQPEELRYWRAHEIEYLERTANAIRESDPEGRPVWMYDPGHRGANGLAYTAAHLDIVGKGMYTNYSGQQENRIWVRWSIEQEIKAIEAANPNAIPIAVPEMFRQPDDDSREWIPRWVRHDVYLSLVSGAEGVVVFSLGRRPNFPDRLTYYEAYAEVLGELTGELELGQVFLFGERRNDITCTVVDGPAELELLYPQSAEEPTIYDSISHLDVAYGDARYLFLVNSANEPVTATIAGLPTDTPVRVVPRLTEDGEAFIASEGEFEETLAPLEVKLYQFYRGDD